jgi:hypothetical protein
MVYNTEVGKAYLVKYVDKNYPCDCDCHRSKNILHFEACCWDKSYSGPAKCIQKFDREFSLFEVSTFRKIKLHNDSVIKEIGEKS